MAAWLAYIIVLPVVGLGLYDMVQRTDSIKRNFPLAGRGRYLALELRPLVQQYFVESDLSGRP